MRGLEGISSVGGFPLLPTINVRTRVNLASTIKLDFRGDLKSLITSLRSMAVLTGALLSCEATKTRANEPPSR